MKILQLLRDNASRPKQPVNLVRNEAEATLYIYDVISADWGVNAMSVIDAIGQAGDASVLNVHINSPGGDVFEGRAIMAALRRFEGKKVAHIDSLCASAATSIALACDEVVMAEGAFFMIHNAMTIAYGNKGELRETADTLEKIDGAIVNDYTTKTGKDAEQVKSWMDAETWFTAAEAKEHGFVDRVLEADKKKKTKNTWNLAAFDKAPKALLRNESDEPTELSEQEKNFLQDMIPHHEMAIEMARAILPNAASEKVRGLAEAIIAAQAGEIALIETWLADTAAPENKKKPMKPMKMQADDPATKQIEEPAAAGFFMSTANANRLRLLQIA
jgi:ATP-dependent Clp protease protease subunit